MQSRHEDTLEEQHAIKFCFKLGKNACHRNVCNALDSFSTILHESSISFWVAWDSRKAGSLWRMMRCGTSKEVNTPELIGQRVRGYYVEVLREFKKRFCQ